MGLRHSRKARRRSRSIRLSGFEPLESRTLLAGDAANTFAVFDGSLTQPDEARPIEIAIRPEDFALPAGGATLGFLLESAGGSGLDPAPVQIQDAGGTPVVPQFVAPDLAGNSQSLVLADLPYGHYRLTVGGEHGTTGAFHLQVLLDGDVNGDRKVDMASGTLIRNIFGSSAGDGHYIVEADANRDGLITSFDYALWRRNLGDTTSLNPLTLVAAASPGPSHLPDGTAVTNAAHLSVQGTTLPGVTVALEAGADGQFDEGTTQADAAGHFTLPVTLSEGTNTLLVRAEDGFGQERQVSLPILLDTHPPTVVIASPSSGLTTNTNVTITGQVTDDGSGVATLQAQVDSGASVPVTFDPAGNFSFTTGLPLTGEADGNHTVHLQATDRAGNISGVSDLTFTLTTTTPGLGVPAGGPHRRHHGGSRHPVPLHGRQSHPARGGAGDHRPDPGSGRARSGSRPRWPADPGSHHHRPEPSRVRHHDHPRRWHARPGGQRWRAT